ncbi:hybrid sensor histidine kinase/response regulator [Hahella sp. CCB-MM4]|uniref:PAS domain S-box protein n=1 Tax=Hahella sp. (strain CCB-MM4) TaxID=1926491 RepID=UPI000B9B0B33|nr:PAS domain S-box protein [Hahella sp. CCB-MM4]OZG74441.1 hybrid sensor histidine kinase/response regulator [Hahella sp. CCB-MM4]
MDKIYRSLSFRISAALIGLVALFAIVAFAGWRLGYQSTLRHLDENMQGQIGLRIEKLSQDLENYRQDLLFLASVPPVQGIVRATKNGGVDTWENSTKSLWIRRLNAIFSSYMNAHPEIVQVRYIGIADQGKEIVRVNRKDDNIEVVSADELQAKGDRGYFLNAIKLSRGEVYFSSIDLNREYGEIEVPHMPTIRVATPVRDTGGDIFGIVIINVKALHLFDKLLQDVPEGYELYLTNLQGDFLIHPELDKTFGFDLGQRFRWDDAFSPTPAKVEVPSRVQFFSSPEGNITAAERQILFTGENPSRGVNLLMTYPEDKIEGQVAQSVISMLLALIAGMVVAGCFLYLYWLNVRQKHKVSVEQARLAAIVESTEDAVIGKTLKGVVTNWNHGAEEMFGYTSQEAIGKRLVELIVPPDRVKEEETILERISKGEKISHFDTKRLRQDGTELDVSVAASPIKDANGEIVGAAKTIRDISPQKAVEEKILHLNVTLEQQVADRTLEIRRYHALQEAILSHAGYAIIATDKEGVITLFNPAAERMLGYHSEEMIGRQTPALFNLQEELTARAEQYSRDLEEPVQPGIDTIVAKSRHQQPNEEEWTYVRKDGSHFQVNLSVTMLFDEAGSTSGYLLMASDISSRVLDRRNMMIMRDHLVKAAEVAELGIWTWNLLDDSLDWNRQMMDIYQVPQEVMETGLYYDYWERSLHPEDKQETLEKLYRALEGSDVFDPVFRIVRADGSTRYIQATAVVERDSEDNPVLMLGINRDITERQVYEQRLQEAKLAADRANKAKTEFLANMSHEIRTPMNAILGMLQLMKNTQMKPQQADYVEKTESSAKALLGILNDILDFSKVEAGKLVLDPQPCNIDDLLKEVGVILSANVGSKPVEILFDIDPDLPESIRVDGMRLQQVLINLAGNAIKFTESGEVVLSVKTFSRSENILILSFSVRDTGIGISKDYLQSIFEGFTQAETSTARRYGGTGLGLTICQRLVTLMGGDLSAESEEGKGSTFSFYIPCTLIEEHQLHVNESLRNLKVLIVDDNGSAREILQGLVSSLGWQVDTVSSGEEAIEIIQGTQPDYLPYDLVLMDWLMPGMDGWEASEKIRALYPVDKLPLIVMITAHKREALEKHQASEPGVVNGFLMKPVTASMILDAVADGMKDSRRQVQPSRKPRRTRLRGISILLVEDNPTNQQVAIELLQEQGAKVDLADDGVKAVEKLANTETTYDVILMDIQMPGMDGYTATRKIREELQLTSIPIIAMTANAMESDREAALACGMNDHVGKPFSINQLVDVILHHARGIVSESPAPDSTDTADANVVLDTETALLRMQGNTSAYRRALSQFLSETPELIDTLAESTEKGDDPETYRRMAHSIKGGAATIGANIMAGLAADLEQIFIEQGNVDGFRDLLAELQWQFTMVQEDAQAFIASERELPEEAALPRTPAQQKNLGKALMALEGLLKEANLQALDIFEGMKDQYSSMYPEEFEELAEAMERMDFEVALACCQNVQKQVEESA